MRGTLRVLTFVGVFFGVVIGIHVYLGQRLLVAPGWPAPYPQVGLWALGALCTAMLANPFTSRSLPEPVAKLIALPAYLWMALAFYLLAFSVAADLVLLLVGAPPPGDHRLLAMGIVGAAALVVGTGALSVKLGPRVRRVEVSLARWPAALNGYRIVQISDVHIGLLLRGGFARRVTERINALQADLVAITGDLVDGSVARLRDEVAPFGDLRARDGVFFVTGNHDHYAGARAWCAELETLGIAILRNRHHSIEREGSRFALAGVDDYSASHHRGETSDVARALQGCPAGVPTVLLAHNPQSFIDGARHGVDLQLSGHTHAGQMWPFRYLVLLQTRFVAGLYRYRDSTLYVSPGTGFWGPPVRVLAPAEITELVLRAPEAA